MKYVFSQVKLNIQKLVIKGFFSIVISNTLAKVVAFLGGSILVRVLSKNDYGLYSYVVNALGFLLILGDMGTGMAVLQFTQENYQNEDKVKGYCAFGLALVIVFSILSMFCIILSPLFYPFTLEGAEKLVLLLVGIPFINNLNTFLQTNLRAHLANNKFALLNILSIIIHYAVLLPMSFMWGVEGAILAQYGYGILTLFFALFFNRKEIFIGKKYLRLLTNDEKRSFFKLSIPSQLNSIISQILILIDIFMVGLFWGDASVIASYKVASVIPSVVTFIPSSIMLFIIPYFSRNKNNFKWIRESYKKLILATFSLCLGISFLGILTSKWVIPLVFGKQYTDVVPCYVILLIGFVFSGGLQIPSVNVIYAQRKIKVNLIITIICGILNVIFDIVGIKMWGSIGAAIATTIISIIGGILSLAYLCIYLYYHKNKLESLGEE